MLSGCPQDPRIADQFVRELTIDSVGDVVLVGVVHDHPASVFRSHAIVSACEPATLALELPPLAVPLFRSLARSSEASLPDGEMAAAIGAAPDANHVGIDALDSRFVRTFLGRARAEGASIETVRRLGREAMAHSRTVVSCRLAALQSPRGSVSDPGWSSNRYDCEFPDPPEVQAEHERAHVARCRAFARAVETPPGIRLRDETREICMADRLEALRRDGDVVAIVGLSHLEPIARRLAAD